jgi:ATP phosphoribosyltransferase regulatory subunit
MRWLLPEHVEDVLPAEAAKIEALRRALLDLFASWGFELVIPPLLEYLDSLLTGTGHDLDLRTFKLVDQLSGKMMGVRADITPQVARIDAHLLNRDSVTRLCYCGSVLHARPAGLSATREPIQIGAEIYGHAGVESDLEVQRLLARSLEIAGVRGVRIDIGHVAVFRALVRAAGIGEQAEGDLFEALQRKDVPALRGLTKKLDAKTRAALLLLPELYGGPEVIELAARKLPDLPALRKALATLRTLARDCAVPRASTSPSCAGTTITRASYSTPIATAATRRCSSRAAGATMRSEERSGGRVRRPDSRSGLRELAGVARITPWRVKKAKRK